jgi:hypothetical protein
MTIKATASEGTQVLTKQVADLSFVDVIHAPGFDSPRTIRRTTKVNKGPQKGKFELHLADENGQVDVADCHDHHEIVITRFASPGYASSWYPLTR